MSSELNVKGYSAKKDWHNVSLNINIRWFIGKIITYKVSTFHLQIVKS